MEVWAWERRKGEEEGRGGRERDSSSLHAKQKHSFLQRRRRSLYLIKRGRGGGGRGGRLRCCDDILQGDLQSKKYIYPDSSGGGQTAGGIWQLSGVKNSFARSHGAEYGGGRKEEIQVSFHLIVSDGRGEEGKKHSHYNSREAAASRKWKCRQFSISSPPFPEKKAEVSI